MARLLILNPNTTEAVTERLGEAARALAPAGALVQAETARFGARYISDEAGAAIAAHAVLDAHAQAVDASGLPDAVLIGCFGDPGLLALRSLCAHPVRGLAEASMEAAAAHGPFVVVTGGAAWAPMLVRLAASVGLSERLCGIETVALTGAQLAADPVAGVQALRELSRQALRRFPAAASVLLGGAALGGWARQVGQGLDRPVIDNVEAALQAVWRDAVRHREAQAATGETGRFGPAQAAVGTGRPLRQPGPSVGLPQPLARWLAGDD